MKNPTDRVENPIIPEPQYCSKCNEPILAKNTVTGEQICMNEKCENYNAEFIKRGFPHIANIYPSTFE